MNIALMVVQYSIEKPEVSHSIVSGKYTIPYTQPGPIAIVTCGSILECPEVYGPELDMVRTCQYMQL